MSNGFCNQCYEGPPTCNNGTGGVTVCETWPAGTPDAYRSAVGNYGSDFRKGLPDELQGMDNAHIDSLTNHQEARVAAVVMTVDNTELRVKLVDGALLRSELGDAGNYLTYHPEDSDLVKRNVNRMYGEYTALQMQIAASILTQAEQAHLQVQAAATAATRAPAATTSEYKQQAEPQAALFQQLVKHVERGDAPVDDGEAMFDPVAGKRLSSRSPSPGRSPRGRTSSTTRSTSLSCSGRA
jgi:hypothetical protein